MSSTQLPLIFDGHNDLVLRLLDREVTPTEVRQGCTVGHIDLPRAIKGGYGGGFFAVFVPSPPDGIGQGAEMQKDAYDIPLPQMLDQEAALSATLDGVAAFEALVAEGVLVHCRSVAEIEATLGSGRLAAVLHLEGADAIDADLSALHMLHARGLRSLGPVWSRPTIFGHGVPFRFPSSPDTGPGLTDAGKRLIRECQALRVVIDLSHMNERGFDDVAALSDAPLVATHSNPWVLCPHTRNLTDRQLAIIAERDGMVGVNLATFFLRADGKKNADVPLDTVLRHFDHLLSILGEDRVGLGSDFDGGRIPSLIGDCTGLPVLLEGLRSHGFDKALLCKLAHKNWLRVLKATWGC